MTLLVRDEADIVESNILFHLNKGVDFIVATDNGSNDGTTEILEYYEKQGVLHLIREPSRVFDQASWVNRMGSIAYADYKGDIIFHCDADEFWYPKSGSLKRELLARPWVDVLNANVINVLMRNRNGEEAFPDDAIYAATNPIRMKHREVVREVDKSSFLLFKYPRKVIYRCGATYLPVCEGNHAIRKGGGLPSLSTGTSYDIRIFHFPVRGFGQFLRKAANGGEARENFDNSFTGKKSDSWHIKRWLEFSRSGKLLDEYNRLTLSETEARKYLDDGVITTNNVYHQKLLSLLSQPNASKKLHKS